MIFFAPNVHTGGGLVLLQSVIDAWPPHLACVAFVDERIRNKVDLPPVWTVHFCKPSFLGRLRAERMLARLSTVDDNILCFHNLPPVMKVRGKLLCYVHNRNLVGLVPFNHNMGWVKFRIFIERNIAYFFRKRVDVYLVQTPTMRRALRAWYRGGSIPRIEIAPFIDPEHLSAPPRKAKLNDGNEWDFLYVSDGTAHKNHLRLFDAWALLAKEGLFPSLAVTLPTRDHVLIGRLNAIKDEHKLNIVNLGHLPHDDLLQCYRRTGALLFASYAESYGIPLLEAKAVQLPIIAAELDFVRDLCEPAQTFDPFSERSIARAVRRHLLMRSDTIEPLSPDKFIEFTCNL